MGLVTVVYGKAVT